VNELGQRAAVYLGRRPPPAPRYVSRKSRILALVFALDVAVLVGGLFLFVGDGGHGELVFAAIVGGIGFLLGCYSLLAGLRRR
jgi:hypothetical protein